MKQPQHNGHAAHPKAGSHSNQRQGHTCAVCKRPGAKWLLWTEGVSQPQMVHKPCGRAAQEAAPRNTAVRVVPSRALREEWAQQKHVASFWEAKLGEAKVSAAAKAVKRPTPVKSAPAQAASEDGTTSAKEVPIVATVT